MLLMWFVANRIYNSGLGRAMRAVREDADVAEAIGKSAFRIKLKALVIGSLFAGIAGGLTIAYVTAMNPSAWISSETFIVFAAMLLGGKANNVGSMVGAFLLPVLLVEGTRFLPQFSDNANLIPGLRVMFISIVLFLVLWFRPQGLVPEKRPFYQLAVRRAKPETTVAS
jgi:ABC-type branched-subunit amino acid transport system permease subunit